jgi:hypothetical protein
MVSWLARHWDIPGPITWWEQPSMNPPLGVFFISQYLFQNQFQSGCIVSKLLWKETWIIYHILFIIKVKPGNSPPKLPSFSANKTNRAACRKHMNDTFPTSQIQQIHSSNWYIYICIHVHGTNPLVVRKNTAKSQLEISVSQSKPRKKIRHTQRNKKTPRDRNFVAQCGQDSWDGSTTSKSFVLWKTPLRLLTSNDQLSI